MKKLRFSLPALIMAVFLAVLISFSCVMCLNDAFKLHVPSLPLLAVCTVAGFLSAFTSVPKRRWPFGLLTAVVVLAAIIWKRNLFFDSLSTMVHAVTTHYSMAFFSVRVVGTPDGNPLWVLLLLAVLLSWLTAWMSSWEGSVVLVLLAVLPVLVMVLLVVDLAPVLWLILLTGGLLILVMSHSVRERSAAAGSLLAWWLVLPTIILLCAVTVLWPPVDYVRPDWSEALRSLAETKTTVENRVETWTQTIRPPQSAWSPELKTVDLKHIGPKSMTGEPALRYRTDGSLSYLRGVSLAVYEDSTWKALDSRAYERYGLTDQPLLNSAVMLHTLEIETVAREPQLYTPYYLASVPEHGSPVDDAYIANSDRLTAYQILYEPSLQYPLGTTEEADRLASEVYTQVPQTLRVSLSAILAENGLAAASPQDIIAYVKASGRYDLNTPAIPAGEDFILYFLQESHRGYCVHFASAAVMLLRTAGIPARYVTGYAVSGPIDTWNLVTEDDAHAWVEYYTKGIGWRPLEATPAGAQEGPPAETEPAPTPAVPEPDEPTETPPEQNTPTNAPDVPKPQRSLAPPKGAGLAVIVPGVPLLLCLRRWFGLRYRRSRCRKGHPNRRALACWRWLVQLSKADRTPIEEDLLCLAEKARFSQHTMTADEIAQLDQAVQGRIQSLRTGPTLKRLWWKYGKLLF